MVKDTKKPVKRRKKRPNLKHGTYSYHGMANILDKEIFTSSINMENLDGEKGEEVILIKEGVQSKIL